ncbi:hypothetical protein DFH06DRAFT_1428091 [Mycena polygramma]|nr:hypothetical protein DFH06DRAFT_1428091 [Mycena polygramma]
MEMTFLRRRSRCVLMSLIAFLVLITLHMTYSYDLADGWPRRFSDTPPEYFAVRQWEAALPQHNLSLPFPEGKSGRYVKFSNQAPGLGWNNWFNEVRMNAHLAYLSGRGNVFLDYSWAPQHYRGPGKWINKWTANAPRTPLNAILSGPIAGGPFEPGDPSPRAISELWFDVVCPPEERRYLNTRDVKPAVTGASGTEVLAHWQAVLRGAPERCIEVVPAEEDTLAQTFDLWLWGSSRLLSLWDSVVESPITRLVDASPIVRSAVEANAYLFLPPSPRPPYPAPSDPFQLMLALHVRRGDFKGHCRYLAGFTADFFSWNQFPFLQDRFARDAPGSTERLAERCWPDIAAYVSKTSEARRDYLAHVAAMNMTQSAASTLDVMYILTNERSTWIEDLKTALRLEGWSVATSQDMILSTQQTDVSMAVDMEIARRAAVFVGNGWSSLTSNVVYQRLVDKRDPITIRYT